MLLNFEQRKKARERASRLRALRHFTLMTILVCGVLVAASLAAVAGAGMSIVHFDFGACNEQ